MKMKKILTLFLTLVIIISSLGALTACSEKSDTPDGMKLVAGSDVLGYYFYAPEGWAVSNVGEIKSCYVSRIDTSSVSFTEVDPFANSDGGGKTKDEYFFDDYFAASLSEFPTQPTVSNGGEGEEIIFGKSGETASRAKRYTFSYSYYDTNAEKTFNYAFMQILVKANDRYYIFQYSASLENRNGTTTTYYDYHLGTEKKKGEVTKIIENFRFVEKKDSSKVEKPTVDKDGFLLVSDSDVSGFKLYVPSEFTKKHNSGMVSASHADGSEINMTEAMGTNENVNTYMLRRLEELGVIATDVSNNWMTDENGNILTDKAGNKIVKYESVKLGNADAANAYEYSFTYNGDRYSVYQVIAINKSGLSYHGYVFTYTAKDVNFNTHFDGVKKAIEKVRFE